MPKAKTNSKKVLEVSAAQRSEIVATAKVAGVTVETALESIVRMGLSRWSALRRYAQKRAAPGDQATVAE